MIRFLWHTIVLLFLTLSIAAFSFQSIVGMKEGWRILIEENYANLPISLWIVILCLAFSLFVALWMLVLTKQKEYFYDQQLNALTNADEQPLKKRHLSRKGQRSLASVHELIQTQKKSLQRITNDKANDQEKIVQERIVQERQRLARELHDSVSQQLFAASMLLSATNETVDDLLPETNVKQLLQTEKIIQQAQLEMRALLLHLRPVALKNKSLAQGLQDLIDELRQKVYFNIHEKLEEVSLPKGAEDHTFRIAQETLSNTLRHSKATEVELLLVQRDQLVIFRVQDNGIGFSMNEENEHAGSYGLRNVEERAIEIGATCKIVSLPNEGTIVEVQIPIKQEESTL